MPVPCSRLTKSPWYGLTIKSYPIFLNGCSHWQSFRLLPWKILIILKVFIPISSLTWFINSSAKISLSPTFASDSSDILWTSIKEYFKSFPKASALLPGIVQGVVVQMTILEPSRSLSAELLIKNLTFVEF